MAEAKSNTATEAHIETQSPIDSVAQIVAPNSTLSIAKNDTTVELRTDCLLRLCQMLTEMDFNAIARSCGELQKIVDNLSENQTKPSTGVKSLCLRVESLHRIFNFLPLKMLYSLCQKCEQLQTLIGEYFRCNFPAAMVTGQPDGIYVHGVSFNEFSGFVKNISILNADLRAFEYFRVENFHSLKQMNLSQIKLTAETIDSSRQILANVEILELIDCSVRGDFGKFLKICTKLKRLSVRNRNSKIVAGSSNQWLCKPQSLDHLKLIHMDGVKLEEMKTFFMRNRNIRSYATSAKCFWENRMTMIESRLKLDLLQIDIDSWAKKNMSSFCKLLNELFKKLTFKRLHLSTRFVDQGSIKMLATLHTLDRLIVVNCESRDIVLHPLVKVKELGISVSCHVNDMMTMATNLTKLQRIFFYKAVSDDVLTLLKHCPLLEEITVVKLCSYDVHFMRGVLNVIALNLEREQLPAAHKVYIYVDESVYLRTKWKMLQMDYSLIAVKRLDEWPDPF